MKIRSVPVDELSTKDLRAKTYVQKSKKRNGENPKVAEPIGACPWCGADGYIKGEECKQCTFLEK